MARMVLDGYAIGVTADRRAEEQCEMLTRRGAKVLHAPAVRTSPLTAGAALRATTERLIDAPPDVLIANTGIGIRAWFAAAESWGLGGELLEALRDAEVHARGPKAAGAVLTAGLDVAYRSPSETLIEVIDHLHETPLAGRRVAIQLDGATFSTQGVAQLRAAGAEVVEVKVYEWSMPENEQPLLRLIDATCGNQLDAITFTSAAAVHNLLATAAVQGKTTELRDAFNTSVLAMCVGPVCAQAFEAVGMRAGHPERARLGAMVHALADEMTRKHRKLQIGGHVIDVQGSLIVIDGEPITLTDRERRVFELLVDYDGAVVSKRELLRLVWKNEGDDHAAEVVIARLRRRLGTVGDAIVTVPRRGYRLSITKP